MKKFIKPEIVAVELSSVEVIMDSKNLSETNNGFKAVSDLEIKESFTEWKGFTD